jgi:hypothetical protein
MPCWRMAPSKCQAACFNRDTAQSRNCVLAGAGHTVARVVRTATKMPRPRGSVLGTAGARQGGRCAGRYCHLQDPNYPADIQGAEGRVASQRGMTASNERYGGRTFSASSAGSRAAAQPASTQRMHQRLSDNGGH